VSFSEQFLKADRYYTAAHLGSFAIVRSPRLLAAVDREVYSGQHIGQVLQMLREISFAFGF
jgi:hypothetical protein